MHRYCGNAFKGFDMVEEAWARWMKLKGQAETPPSSPFRSRRALPTTPAKSYVVFQGHMPAVYDTWSVHLLFLVGSNKSNLQVDRLDAAPHVTGVSRNVHAKYATREDGHEALAVADAGGYVRHC